MKVYMLTESDFERLRLRLGQDPRPGGALSPEQRTEVNAAVRTMTYVVETWIAEVQKA